MANAIIVKRRTVSEIPSDSVVIEYKGEKSNGRVICKNSKPITIENESGSVKKEVKIVDLVNVKFVGNREANKVIIAQKLYDISSLAESTAFHIDMIDYKELDEEIILDKLRSAKSFLNILSEHVASVASLFDDEDAIFNP